MFPLNISLLILLVACHPDCPNGKVPDGFSYPKPPQIRVLQKTHKVRAIKGKITGPFGSKISGKVLVEVITDLENEKRVIACFADSNGNFDLGIGKKGKYYLKVSMEGFDSVYITVLLTHFGRDELNIELPPST
jgi:hypothetical protein